MSLQRTPPHTTSVPKLNAPTNSTLHYNSDSALNISNKPELEDNYFNITKRQKRTFEDVNNDSTCHFSDIQAMIIELKSQQEHKFVSLNSALNMIINQNSELQKSVESISSQHQELLSKISNVEKENRELKEQVSNLESHVNFFEKQLRCTTIEVRNLPKQTNETKRTLANRIQEIGAAVGLTTNIQESEIRDVFRLKSETILVDFTTTERKESFISKFKTFNKARRESKEPQLNTGHLDLPGHNKQLFISEYLSKQSRKLFYLARTNVKENKLAATWTSFGNIYVKKSEDSLPIRIKSEVELGRVLL
ncbi:unnamed protein product [Arctia plantaginis]|uniref:FP protein C-terminal domain-containing protein n=1 Tax=Arctia plantaginis TaxID=874455 RepID=A0A8S0ZGV7_ARCPL|nr:unnamed protein product [Arctia plantaginis]